MLGLNDKLKRLEKEGKSIKVALVGIGQMGSSLICQIRDLLGIDIVAVANRNVNNAAKILKRLGFNLGQLVFITDRNKVDCEILKSQVLYPKKGNDFNLKNNISNAILSGKVLVTDQIEILPTISQVDVVVEATGNPEAGAYIAFESIRSKKHIVTFNVEADTTIGPLLKKMADDAGVVYTVAVGDEPAAAKELYDLADGAGLEVIAAGKGKNNPLDREANPTTLAEYAASKGSNARMMTSFVDGTKSMFEMACLSNATGLIPDVRGMHGPKANVNQLPHAFSLKAQGGILNKKGVVDFALGDVAPGVFLIYSSPLKIIRDELKYLLFGDGPNYLLYRPYHLTSIEAPLSVAKAYFQKEPTIVSKNGLVSEVVTYAKKDLKAGEVLDGIGGYMVYGLIDLYQVSKEEKLLPLGLSEGCILESDIEKDQLITFEDVKLVENSMILRLRRLQDNTKF